jgi:hypothetical protein
MRDDRVIQCMAIKGPLAKGGSFCVGGANAKRQNAELRKGPESYSAFDLEPKPAQHTVV